MKDKCSFLNQRIIDFQLPSSVQSVDDDSQPTSSSSLPADGSHDEENRALPTVPFVLSDSETLDEGFETQSNVSETVEATPRSCPMETRSIDIPSSRVDETLAEQLTKRLSFNANRRSSHDSSIRSNSKRNSTTNNRSISSLRTSTSAYSYPSFASIDQQTTSTNKCSKRTPSVESLRLPSTNNTNNAVSGTRVNQHIQRCAVSRRISTEKESDETSKSLTNSPQSASVPTTMEPDEISSSSTVTTTATTVINTKINPRTTTTTTTTISNRQLPTNKSKTKIRNLNNSSSSPRSNSPNIRKISPRLTHANSYQNVSTITNNTTTTPKSSPSTTKSRSPPNFFLNSTQLLRSTFTRSTDKPLRALPLSPNLTHETSSSSKSRRLFSSNHDLNATSTASPKSSRKPPSSWHNPKSLTNKTSPLTTTVLHSSNLTSNNRKTSSSTTDLRKTTSSFQRLTQSKRF